MGGRSGRGIDDWADGIFYELAMFFDDDQTGFTIGLPGDPAPLSPDEHALITSID